MNAHAGDADGSAPSLNNSGASTSVATPACSPSGQVRSPSSVSEPVSVSVSVPTSLSVSLDPSLLPELVLASAVVLALSSLVASPMQAAHTISEIHERRYIA